MFVYNPVRYNRVSLFKQYQNTKVYINFLCGDEVECLKFYKFFLMFQDIFLLKHCETLFFPHSLILFDKNHEESWCLFRRFGSG